VTPRSAGEQNEVGNPKLGVTRNRVRASASGFACNAGLFEQNAKPHAQLP
jgi:hypothetical protein